MEKFPVLRRLPKRIICLYLTCAMFGACALFTLYIESDHPLPTTVQNVVEAADLPPGWSWKRKLIGSNTSESSSSSSFNISDTSKSGSTKYIQLTSVSPQTSSTRGTTPVPVSADTCDSPMLEDSKLILLWTGFFDYWDYLPNEKFAKCEKCRNCKVTRDRYRLKESDAVIFHCRDMSLSDLPAVRYPHQRWVFYCLESPPYSDFPGLQYMKNMFNWTMTYRSDSDIVTQYGSVSRVRPPRKLDLPSLRSAFLNKSLSVVWMSSHCPTAGGRDDFVSDLRKHIDVHVFGSCGSSVCPPGDTQRCLADFASTYRFFLAFENTICKDYITEKFFRTLRYDIIPVVFGGAPYDRLAPPGSFVDALSFRSPKHLAFFLSGVGNDFKLYSSYFKWREDFAVRLSNQKECQLCEMLHRTDLEASSYQNLRKWWVDGSQCRSWTRRS